MPSPAEILAKRKAAKPPPKQYRKVIWRCRLNEMRNKLGLSMREVEAATKITTATITQVERGMDLNLTTARALAAFFGVAVEEMWPVKWGEELRGK